MTRLGGTRPRAVDVRVVGATNRPLEEMVREGTFREDLLYRLRVIALYRLRVIALELPPLRERRGDIPAFATSSPSWPSGTRGRYARSGRARAARCSPTNGRGTSGSSATRWSARWCSPTER